MLPNVILTDLLLFWLLIRIARYLLGQPACAGSFNICGGEGRANSLSLAWDPHGSHGQSKVQPFVKVTTIAALPEEAAAAKPANLFSENDVCGNALENRKALDACFTQMANLGNI
jgi:hypothetical protein